MEGQEQKARQIALEFLLERGVFVEEGKIPQEMSLLPLELIWDRSLEGGYAQAFLGDVEMESLGGEIVRYFNKVGELRFHDNGAFYGSFLPSLYCGLVGEEEALAEGVLSILGMDGILAQRLESDGEVVLVYWQALSGVPLLGCEVRFLFVDGGLEEILSGKRLEGEFLEKQQEHRTVASALVQCYQGFLALGTEVGEILEIISSYQVSTPLISSAILSPGWLLHTDSGVFFLDTATGVLESWG